MAALLLRLYDVNKGTILLDGRDITGLDKDWLRNQVCGGGGGGGTGDQHAHVQTWVIPIWH